MEQKLNKEDDIAKMVKKLMPTNKQNEDKKKYYGILIDGKANNKFGEYGVPYSQKLRCRTDELMLDECVYLKDLNLETNFCAYWDKNGRQKHKNYNKEASNIVKQSVYGKLLLLSDKIVIDIELYKKIKELSKKTDKNTYQKAQDSKTQLYTKTLNDLKLQIANTLSLQT